MSFAKRQLEENEEHLRIAKDLCVQAGSLTQCEVCDDIFDELAGPDEAYELAAELIANNDPLVESFNGSLTALRTAIDDAIADSPSECDCARKFAKDD